jgi:hypothetical protein
MLTSILLFKLSTMDKARFFSAGAESVSVFVFLCQHTVGRASAALCDACTAF